MDGHNHLDRQVRQPGECPGCDLIWERQRARLTAARPMIALTKQLDRMADKPAHRHTGLCTAIHDDPPDPDGGRVITHTCNLPADHPPPHICPLCDNAWTGR